MEMQRIQNSKICLKKEKIFGEFRLHDIKIYYKSISNKKCPIGIKMGIQIKGKESKNQGADIGPHIYGHCHQR